VAHALVEQAAAGGPLLAPVLHLHGPGGWQHVTVSVANPDEARGSLGEARAVTEHEAVDAFVCIVQGEHAAALAEALDVGAGSSVGLGYAADSLTGEGGESAGLGEIREGLARLLLGRT
jgi:hypothetical protein